MPKLLALHGFTLNGDTMRRQMGPLRDELEKLTELEFVNGPQLCSEEVVARLYREWRAPRPRGPHRKWWDASDDGLVYEGWEETQELLRPLLSASAPVGLIGFSQGAIVATAVAALASAGQLLALKYVVLISGARPRARAIAPFLEVPLRLPSCHIWGDADHLMRERSPKLVESFDAQTREVHHFSGGHEFPRDARTQEAIVDFVRRHG